MFQYNLSQNISDGDVDTTNIGTISPPTNNVVSGILNVVETGSSTATVTIILNSTTYVIPTLDLSDADNQVPFVLPIPDLGNVNPLVSVAVTGADGAWNLILNI